MGITTVTITNNFLNTCIFQASSYYYRLKFPHIYIMVVYFNFVKIILSFICVFISHGIAYLHL